MGVGSDIPSSAIRASRILSEYGPGSSSPIRIVPLESDAPWYGVPGRNTAAPIAGRPVDGTARTRRAPSDALQVRPSGQLALATSPPFSVAKRKSRSSRASPLRPDRARTVSFSASTRRRYQRSMNATPLGIARNEIVPPGRNPSTLPLHRALQYAKLVAEGDDLKLQRRPGSKNRQCG